MFTSILQPTHLLIVLIVALVFLGPKRLPSAGRALGQGLREFRSSISGEAIDEEIAPAPPALERTGSPSAMDDRAAGAPSGQQASGSRQ